VFLTQRTIKAPDQQHVLGSEIVDLKERALPTIPGSTDDDSISVLTRSAITSTLNSDPQARLWSRGGLSCGGPLLLSKTKEDQVARATCQPSGNALLDLDQLEDPFLAQLPAGYNTGLLTQFLPRIKSSASRSTLPVEEWPLDCGGSPGSFHAHYSGSQTPRNGTYTYWNVEACMPADLRVSPWRSTRERQDFLETLYLNLSLGLAPSSDVQGGLFKIQLNTTAGYFELPNYMNGQQPGPLIDGDPSDLCEQTCPPQFDDV